MSISSPPSRFCELLHEKGISSFLVTNAQFPSAIANMVPVTQLYVSIDASTKDSLKKIDRPLFRDFWERFIESLKALSTKGQRTVYRLTLVKGWNAEEMDNYAKLVEIGRPDFLEIKGVTFCGTSKGEKLFLFSYPILGEKPADDLVVLFLRIANIYFPLTFQHPP